MEEITLQELVEEAGMFKMLAPHLLAQTYLKELMGKRAHHGCLDQLRVIGLLLLGVVAVDVLAAGAEVRAKAKGRIRVTELVPDNVLRRR